MTLVFELVIRWSFHEKFGLRRIGNEGVVRKIITLTVITAQAGLNVWHSAKTGRLARAIS